jgi:hypothetical protein
MHTHYTIILYYLGFLAREGHGASFTAFVVRLEAKNSRKYCFESCTSDIRLPFFLISPLVGFAGSFRLFFEHSRNVWCRMHGRQSRNAEIDSITSFICPDVSKGTEMQHFLEPLYLSLLISHFP